MQLDHGEAKPYHVGDSQILLVGNRGRVKMLTTSHSPVGYAVEAGMLEEHDAIDHDHGQVRVVGSNGITYKVSGSSGWTTGRQTFADSSMPSRTLIRTSQSVVTSWRGGLAGRARSGSRVATSRV